MAALTAMIEHSYQFVPRSYRGRNVRPKEPVPPVREVGSSGGSRGDGVRSVRYPAARHVTLRRVTPGGVRVHGHPPGNHCHYCYATRVTSSVVCRAQRRHDLLRSGRPGFLPAFAIDVDSRYAFA
ncbi:hypothetical protein Trydic_g20045 [Trypoxylus dichotomus]